MADVNLDIRLQAQGGPQSAAQIESIQSVVQKTRDDLERFQQFGGLGVIAVGAEKINEAKARTENLGSALLDAEKRAAGLRDELKQVEAGTLKRTDAQVDQIRSSLAQSENAAAAFRKELALIPRDLREGVADSVGYLGDIDSSLQAISGAADEFGRRIGGSIGRGLQGIAVGARLSGEVFAVAEALPRFAGALDQLRENIGKIIPALTANVGNLSKIGVAAGALAAAYVVVNRALADGRREAEAFARAQEHRIEVERRLRTLTAEAGQERISDLQANIAQELTARDELIQQINEQFDDSSFLEIITTAGNRLGDSSIEASNALESVAFGLFSVTAAAGGLVGGGGGLEELASQVDAYNQSIGEMEAELAELNAPIEARAAYAELRTELEREREIAELAATATSDQVDAQLARIRADREVEESLKRQAAQDIERLTARQQRGEELSASEIATLEEARRVFNETQAAVIQLDEAERQLVEDVEPLVQLREAETEALEGQKNALRSAIEARNQENSELADTIESLRAEGERATDTFTRSKEALADFQQQLDNEQARALREAERSTQEQALLDKIARAKSIEAERAKNARVANELTQAAGKQQEIVAKANDEARKINDDFMASELKAIQDFQREQKRLREDIEDDLLQAATENDVNAFIRIQREGLKALGRGDEDFSAERQQALAERNARLEELKLGQQKEIAQLQEQTNARLEQLQEAGEQELSQSQRLEQQLNDLRESFRQEDARLEEQTRQKARQVRLADLQQQYEETRLAMNAIFTEQRQAATALLQSMGQLSLANIAAMTDGPSFAQTAATHGGSTFAPNVTIHQNVGDIASKSYARNIALEQSQGVVNGMEAIFRSGGTGAGGL